MRLAPRFRIGLLAIALGLPLSLGSPASACPNCKEALASDPAGQADGAGDISVGFSRSILLMMAMPFALLGAGTVAVVWIARRGGIPQL
jgi:hypothetical protein